jgi:diguanylate cyclase (GGDEF)-like protein
LQVQSVGRSAGGIRLKIFRLTLVGRLALAIACLILLPASLMTAHLYHKDRNAAIDKEMRRIHTYSREVAFEIDSFIISQKSIARYAVANSELLDFLKHDASATVTKFNRWLESWYDISQNISEVFVMDLRGICIASTDPTFIGKDYSIRPYFKEAMQGRHFVSDWMIGITSKKPGIYLSSPIPVSDSSIGGVLVIKLNPDPIDVMIRRSFGLGVQAFIVNNAGVLLAHYDPELRYSTIGDLSPEESAAIRQARQFADIPQPSLKLDSLRRDVANVRPGLTLTSAEYRFQNTRKIAALTGTTSMDWVVGITVPFTSIEASANRLLYTFIPLILLVLLFTVLSAFYVSRKIVRPLGNLLQKAILLGAGDYSVHADIKGDDEVAQLAKAFNGMALQIRTEKEELEAKVNERTAQLQIAYEEIKAFSVIDAMTGCFNRHYMDEHLLQEIQRARRYDRRLSVIMCDIDHFKRINDTWGHQTGDRVLIEVSTFLRGAVRQDIDWVARYGGEEFLIVLPETSTTAAATFAERLRGNLENLHIDSEGRTIRVTASFGLATLRTDNDEESHALLGRADALLLKAKQSGRNRIVC